jgi:hypothetical protein
MCILYQEYLDLIWAYSIIIAGLVSVFFKEYLAWMCVLWEKSLPDTLRLNMVKKRKNNFLLLPHFCWATLSLRIKSFELLSLTVNYTINSRGWHNCLNWGNTNLKRRSESLLCDIFLYLFLIVFG